MTTNDNDDDTLGNTSFNWTCNQFFHANQGVWCFEHVLSNINDNEYWGEFSPTTPTSPVHGHIGLPSSPSLTVVAESLQHIISTISLPSYASQCALNYTITATRSDGSVVPDITVEVSDNITLSEGGFNLCNNVYNFTVVANTLAGPGQRSAVVSPEVNHFLSKFYTHEIVMFS